MADPSPVQSFYGRWAGLYDLLARWTPGIAAFRRRATAACRLERGDTVLEMGCGTGVTLPSLRDAVGPSGTVVGVDVTGPVLTRARARSADWENVHVVRADATRPPLAPPVDAVLATFLVGMLEEPAGAVEDWCDLVAPGGHVVLGNAATSDRSVAPLVNPLLRAVTVLSTPPTGRLRYGRDPLAVLDDRVRAAHGRLRERAGAVSEHAAAGGVLRMTGGRIDT